MENDIQKNKEEDEGSGCLSFISILILSFWIGSTFYCFYTQRGITGLVTFFIDGALSVIISQLTNK